MESDEALRPLAQGVMAAAAGGVLVVTGAGVSLASGSPRLAELARVAFGRDVKEVGTHRYFREGRAGSWQEYPSRFEKVVGTKLNAAHHALASMERWQLTRGGRFLLVTQNPPSPCSWAPRSPSRSPRWC